MELVAVNIVFNGIVVSGKALCHSDIFQSGQNSCKYVSLSKRDSSSLGSFNLQQEQESTSDVLTTHHPIVSVCI